MSTLGPSNLCHVTYPWSYFSRESLTLLSQPYMATIFQHFRYMTDLTAENSYVIKYVCLDIYIAYYCTIPCLKHLQRLFD